MATVNGTAGKDFIHRAGDGRIAPAGYNDLTGVTIGNDVINGFADDDILFGDSGIDLLDGTPILDIKPYIPYCDAFPDAKAGWVDELPAAELQYAKRPVE